MVTAIVRFKLPASVNAEEARTMYEASAPFFRSAAGLVRKYYLLSEDGASGGGVYLWESREAAERCYYGEGGVVERIRGRYGSEPEITFFETPVIVDNAARETISG